MAIQIDYFYKPEMATIAQSLHDEGAMNHALELVEATIPADTKQISIYVLRDPTDGSVDLMMRFDEFTAKGTRNA